MTLLSAVNNAQRLLSLSVTASVIADTQETQQLLYGLANSEAADVLRREFYWPLLTRTKNFTASLASLQAAGKASDFSRAVPDTFWNTTTKRPIAGPLNAQEWSRANGQPVTSAIQQYAMFRYDGLHLFPNPTSADAISYDYITNTPVLAADTTYKTAFSVDTDTYVFSEDVLKLALIWRYKQSKGRDYAEDLRNYELALASEYEAQRGAARVLSLSPSDDPDIGAANLPTVFG